MTDSVESVLQKLAEEISLYVSDNQDVGYIPSPIRLRVEIREMLRSALEPTLAELGDARRHTQDWYAAHYGKLHDWARKRLPEPHRSEFFCCIANGTWGFDDVGEPYMSQVGQIVPSGYVKFDSAQEQILHDQSSRAEAAEQALREAQATTCRNYYRAEVPIEQNKTLKAANENLRDLLGEAVGWVALHQSPSALDLRGAIDEALSPFPTPRQYTNRKGDRCSQACGEDHHGECTETYETCNCTCRVGHNTPHRYSNIRAAATTGKGEQG